ALVDRPGRRPHPLPVLVTVVDPRVLVAVHLLADALTDDLVHLVWARPQVFQVHGPAGPNVLAQRILGQVAPDGTGKGVRHHQRWRCEVAGAHQRVDAGLEV